MFVHTHFLCLHLCRDVFVLFISLSIYDLSARGSASGRLDSPRESRREYSVIKKMYRLKNKIVPY